MLVKYRPEGQEQPTEWDFDPKRVRQSEAELIEKRMPAGTTYQQWVGLVQAGDSRARRVLLWHLQRREHHTLRYEDSPDFYFGELEVDYSLAELRLLREQIVASTVDDAEKAQILNKLDLEIGEQLQDEEVSPQDVGKARSQSDG